MTESSNANQIVEDAISNLRNSFQKALAIKDQEISNTRALLVQREMQIQDLQRQIASLQRNFAAEQSRSTELSKRLLQLYEFKKSVVNSLSASKDDGLDTDVESFSRIHLTELERQLNDIGADGIHAIQNGRQYDTSARKKPTARLEAESNMTLNTRPFGSTETIPEEQSGQQDPLNGSNGFGRLADIDGNHAPRMSNDDLTRQPQPTRQHKPDPMHPDTHQQQQSYPDSTQMTNAVDGRDFFLAAKSKLSYDEFTGLLWNVKAYNNREQNRSTTLQNVKELFGRYHGDLYGRFESLMAQ